MGQNTDLCAAAWSAVDALLDPRRRIIFCEVTCSPMAQAYRLLERLGIGPDLGSKQPHAGRLDFTEGPHPGNSSRWVEAWDDLSVTLLQARLVELRQPIRVVMAVENVQREW